MAVNPSFPRASWMNGPLGPLPRGEAVYPGPADAAREALRSNLQKRESGSASKESLKLRETGDGEMLARMGLFCDVALRCEEAQEGQSRVVTEGRPTVWLPLALAAVLALAGAAAFVDGFSIMVFALALAVGVGLVYLVFYVAPAHYAQEAVERALEESTSYEAGTSAGRGGAG